MPKIYIRDFIRGYFDGDGCFTYDRKNKNNIVPVISMIGTLEFLSSIKSILDKSNIKSSIINDSRFKNNTKILSISNTDSMKFLQYIYENSIIYLDRKYKRFTLFSTKDSRSSEQLLELLTGKIGEDCDVNTEVTNESKKSLEP